MSSSRGIRNNVPDISRLIDAVISQESSGDPTAVSPKGARGLMQLMPDTAREVAGKLGLPYDEGRLTSDPEYNRTLGTRYLQDQLDAFGGNETLALAAYNAGPGNVQKWLASIGDPRTGTISDEEWSRQLPFAETRNYVSRIRGKMASADLQQAISEEDLQGTIRESDLREAVALEDQETERHAVASSDLQQAIREDDRRFSPIQPGDISPVDPIDRHEEDIIRAEAGALAPDFVEGVEYAIKQEWGVLWAFNSQQYAPDPSWSPDKNWFKEHTQDVPEDYREWLATRAHSEEHFQYLKGILNHDLEMQKRLSSMGWEGTALSFAAAVLDPVALGIGLASDGVAAPFVVGLKASRLGRIMAAAGTAAVGNTAAELVPYAYKPTHSALDLLYAAAGGAALGGLFGSLGRNPHVAAERDALVNAGGALAQAVETQAAARLGSPEHLKHAGAAEASYREALRYDTYDLLSALDNDTAAPRSANPFRARFDLANQMGSSENPLVRLGRNLVEEAVGNEDRGIATAYGATEWQKRVSRAFETRWAQTRETAYVEWAKDQGLNPLQRQWSRGEFYDTVTRYVRNEDPTVQFHPAVARLGEQYRTLRKQILELANNPGAPEGRIMRPVQGFGGTPDEATHVVRSFDHAKIDRLTREFGDKNLRAFLKRAIQSAVPDMADDLAEKYAKGYLQVVRKVGYGMEASTHGAFSGDNIDLLKKLLKEEGGIADEDIEGIASLLKRKTDGAHTRAKQRMDINENFTDFIRFENGTGGRHVRFDEFLNNDIDYLFGVYNRQLTGAAAMARFTIRDPEDGRMLVNGITSRGEWDTYLDQVRAVAAEKGISKRQLDEDIENLEFSYRAVMGIPPDTAGKTAAQVMRMLGDYNFIRVMNQVGIAQIPEIGNITGQLGMRAALQNMPGLRALWRNAKTGQIGDELSNELEYTFGIGADYLRGASHHRWDDFDAIDTYRGENRWVNAIDQGLQRGKRATSVISGMSGINTILHRWAMRGIVGKFAMTAFKQSKANMNRMRSLGLSDDMLNRVLAQTKQHFTTEDGLWAKKVKRLNLDKWDDLEAREAFKNAVDRWARRIIQENDPGMMAKWMSSTWAKLFLQFRSFAIGAWSKQFLHNVHMRDSSTFAAFLGSMVWAGVSYIMQTHAQSIGRSDRERFLEDRLSVSNLGKAAFQRAGFASISPMGLDAALMFSGLDPQFDFRTTGQPTNILVSPTVDLVLNKPAAIGGAFHGIFGDRPLSQRELRDLNSVLPFSNFLPWQQVFNLMINGNPERPKG